MLVTSKIKTVAEMLRGNSTLTSSTGHSRTRRLRQKCTSHQLFPDSKQPETSQDQESHVNIYHSGVQFIYGYEGEHVISGISTYDRLTDPEIHFDDTTAAKVAVKYNDLKEELISNPISSLFVEQYISTYQKAAIHFETAMRKDVYHKLQLEHVLSLMVYSTFDVVQFKFS